MAIGSGPTGLLFKRNGGIFVGGRAVGSDKEVVDGIRAFARCFVLGEPACRELGDYRRIETSTTAIVRNFEAYRAQQQRPSTGGGGQPLVIGLNPNITIGDSGTIAGDITFVDGSGKNVLVLKGDGRILYRGKRIGADRRLVVALERWLKDADEAKQKQRDRERSR